MVARTEVNLIPYRLHPYWAALIEWGKKHPYGRIRIVFQDGIPMTAIVPTDDGIGEEKILFRKVAKELGFTE
jgi:hypothetical protein